MASLLPSDRVAMAQPAQAVQLLAEGNDVRLHWSFAPPGDQISAASLLDGVPLRPFNGYMLPIRLVTVALRDSRPLAADIQHVASVPWSGELALAGELAPPALDFEPDPAFAPSPERALPSAPVFLLREGTLRDTRIAVLAVSPIYQGVTDAGPRLATQLDAVIAGAALLADNAATILAQNLSTAGAVIRTAGVHEDAPAATNPLASQSAVKIKVAQAGIQRVTGAQLGAAGMNLADADLGRLQLYLNGAEVRLQVIDRTPQGQLNDDDEIRFYAEAPGDRWNATDTYWLVVASTPGARMDARSAIPLDASAPLRSTARQRGVWELNAVYESTIVSQDGERWFAKAMRVGPTSSPVDYPTLDALIETSLPPAGNAGDQSTFRVTGVIHDRRPRNSFNRPVGPPLVAHKLHVQVEGTAETFDWTVDFDSQPIHDFSHQFSAQDEHEQQYTVYVPFLSRDGVAVASAGGSSGEPASSAAWPSAPRAADWSRLGLEYSPTTTSASDQDSATTLRLTLLPTSFDTGLRPDKIWWDRPVALDFGNRGAAFTTVDGSWRYQLSDTPVGRMLYDITDPQNPVVLTATDGATVTVQDGNSARTYLVTGSGTMHTPVVTEHQPVAFSAQAGADVIYIAPAKFHAALQPLLDLRRDQGYVVAVVKPQDIYDGWNYGHVDARALRDFLRFAFFNWTPRPVAAVVVGDGSWDPFHYEGKYAENVMPPYMADVDPWLRETACENCLAQLHGEDPLSESAFLIDLWVGRFPVETEVELTTLVDKIVGYERTVRDTASWRNATLFVADNYYWPNSDCVQRDTAGDFARFSDAISELQDPRILTQRVFYDPCPHITDPAGMEPWRRSDATQARVEVFDAMTAGPGMVTYNGHANPWQMSVTDNRFVRPYLFNLIDVPDLANGDRLFIQMSMTCFTSQFTRPGEYSHTTLDEALVLHDGGGAVAAWGPAGLSVAHGHDALQTGFHRALSSATPLTARLGELIEAGYFELVTTSTCCQDVANTFVLLGDPLTVAGLQPLERLYLPLIGKDSAN